MSSEIYNDLMRVRLSGGVARFHTVALMPPQRVDSHVAQMLFMLFALHPSPSVNLISAVLHHDAPEQVIGDIPSPATHMFPMLGDAKTHAEQAVISSNSILRRESQRSLNSDDIVWLSGLDIVECFLTCLEQQVTGNRAVTPILTRISKYVEAMELPPELREFYEHIKSNDPIVVLPV